MDDLARQYETRYHEALDLATAGDKAAARDICWELRLDPRISKYRRALVNLLLGFVVDHDQLLFARECLDICNILRQEHEGDVSDNIKHAETAARSLIQDLESTSSSGPAPEDGLSLVDPTTSLHSDPLFPPDSTMEDGIKKSVWDAEVGDQVLLEDGEIGNVIASIEAEGNQYEEMVEPFSFEGMFRTSEHEPRVPETAAHKENTAFVADLPIRRARVADRAPGSPDPTPTSQP